MAQRNIEALDFIETEDAVYQPYTQPQQIIYREAVTANSLITNFMFSFGVTSIILVVGFMIIYM